MHLEVSLIGYISSYWLKAAYINGRKLNMSQNQEETQMWLAEWRRMKMDGNG